MSDSEVLGILESVEEFLIKLEPARNVTCCAKHRNAQMARVAEELASKIKRAGLG